MKCTTPLTPGKTAKEEGGRTQKNSMQPKNKEIQRTLSRQRNDAKEWARRILGSEQPRVDSSAHLVAACLEEEEPFEEESFEQQHYGQLDFYTDEQSLFDAYGLEAIEDVAIATTAAAISPMRRQNHHHHNSNVIRVPMLEDIQEIISQENSFGQDSQ